MRLCACVVLVLTLFTSRTWAGDLNARGSLRDDLQSEMVPAAFTPIELHESWFRMESDTPPLTDVRVELLPDSIQWVRLSEVLVLPRARARLSGRPGDRGVIRLGTEIHAFEFTAEKLSVEFIVPLMSGVSRGFDVVLRREGSEQKSVYHLKYAPPSSAPQFQFHADSSCSPYRFDAVKRAGSHPGWLMLGCKTITAKALSEGRVDVQLYLYWDEADSAWSVNGISQPALVDSPAILTVSSFPSEVELVHADSRVAMNYRVPERFHRLNAGLGFGPYQYHYQGGTYAVDAIAPLTTFYGSFFVTESTRFVAFDAGMIHRNFFNDLGIYFNSESIRTIDQRVSVNLLLGGHQFTVKESNGVLNRFSLPQGVEFVVRDFILPRYILNFGAFLYPTIGQRSYYNLWARYGFRGIFGEVNYLSVREPSSRIDQIYIRALGVSIGFPLFQAF